MTANRLEGDSNRHQPLRDQHQIRSVQADERHDYEISPNPGTVQPGGKKARHHTPQLWVSALIAGLSLAYLAELTGFALQPWLRSPARDAAAAFSAIKPGMTWKQACDAVAPYADIDVLKPPTRMKWRWGYEFFITADFAPERPGGPATLSQKSLTDLRPGQAAGSPLWGRTDMNRKWTRN